MTRVMRPAPSVPGDLLDERFRPWGEGPLLLVDAAQQLPQRSEGAIVIALDRSGSLPSIGADLCDAMVTVALHAPAPWVSVSPGRLEGQVGEVRRAVARAPVAAGVLVEVLRINERLAFGEALAVESLAYSTLLAGGEFARWLANRKPKPEAASSTPTVRYDRDGGVVSLTLDDSPSRNAMSASMRDALCEALINVWEDPSAARLILRGAGRCFSAGGSLPEFGSARDLALAHAVRQARSPARLLHAFGDRVEAQLRGACIGSGIEIAAAAARRVGARDTFIQLPELRMGLIPGAGGTVTIPRVIGRHRTAWLALGGFRLSARAALDWGLLHAIAP
jgi:hypothetical protein